MFLNISPQRRQLSNISRLENICLLLINSRHLRRFLRSSDPVPSSPFDASFGISITTTVASPGLAGHHDQQRTNRIRFQNGEIDIQHIPRGFAICVGRIKGYNAAGALILSARVAILTVACKQQLDLRVMLQQLDINSVDSRTRSIRADRRGKAVRFSQEGIRQTSSGLLIVVMKQKVDQPHKPLTCKKGKGHLKKKDVRSSYTWGKAEQERFKYEWKTRECPTHEIVSRDCLIAK
jgi:hypothetical protein